MDEVALLIALVKLLLFMWIDDRENKRKAEGVDGKERMCVWCARCGNRAAVSVWGRRLPVEGKRERREEGVKREGRRGRFLVRSSRKIVCVRFKSLEGRPWWGISLYRKKEGRIGDENLSLG